MEFRAIGLMSGTSLDGLDLCFAKFLKENNSWTYQILKADTIAYPQHWDEKLRDAIKLNSQELLALHSEYGFYLGKRVQEFVR